VPARIEREEVLTQLNAGVSARRPMHEWKAEGVHPEAPMPDDAGDDAQAALVMLEEPAAMTYWLGFNNFYVLTRYNRSRLYASAVWELARKVRHAAEALPESERPAR